VVPSLIEMPEQDLYARACAHGWTHACGSGKSIARIVSGLKPEVEFPFVGI